MMIARIFSFALVLSSVLLGFSSQTQAQACTSTASCPAGYNIIDCAVGCSGVFATGQSCIVGTSGADSILIFGSGNHLVCGNGGDDTIQFISATAGNFIWGGDGADNISGTGFNDFIFGEGGNDILSGGDGADFISGGDGNDTLNGEGGGDSLDGGAGDDNLSGGTGADTLNGGTGADILLGGADGDTLNGGDDNDQLNGNNGIDTLNGGGGDDTLLNDGNSDGDAYNGGDGNDIILADDGANNITGGAGNDYIEGGGGDDTISGGTGYDQLFGEAGDDNISGNDDPDVLDGGAGTDVLNGGPANDTCLNGENVTDCENLTAARLASSLAYPYEGGTVVEWQTLFEAGTAGFELRVREGEKWRALHRGLLAADVAGYAGARYAYFIPTWDAQAEYEIREVENTGLRTSIGTLRPAGVSQRPFAVLSAALPFASKSIEVDQTWRLAPLNRSERRLLADTATTAKVGVATDGVQRITLASLAGELGVSVVDLESRIENRALSVKLGDEQVSWAKQGDSLFFVGAGSDSPYSAERFYRIELSEGTRVAMQNLAVDADAKVLGSYRATSTFEADTFAARVVPIDPSVDTWFSHALSPTTPGKESVTVPVSLNGYAGGEGVVEIELQGASFDPMVAVEHVFDVELNGSVVGEIRFSAFGRETATFVVSAADLKDGENEVKVISTAHGSEDSISYLDRVSISYDRNFIAQNDALAFAADDSGTVRISGFSNEGIALFEIDAEGTVRMIEGADIETNETTEVAFSVTTGASYWASAASKSLDLWADSTAALRELSSGAQYIVVTRADLMADAEKLAAHRREQGFSTLVVDVDDVYDEYAGGQPTPDALRAFFKDAYDRWATKPRYAVLAGASHFDYHDRLGFGVPLVPAYQVQVHNGIISSDLPMVDFNDDGVPEVALGRLPAASAEELEVMVDKLVAYDDLSAPTWSNQVTLVSDRPDDSFNFGDDLDLFADALPRHLTSSKLLGDDMDRDALRSELQVKVQAGTAWVHYLGHGGLAQWSQGSGILTSEDVDGWAARDSQPFVTAGTCLTGAYDFPGVRSLGEAWIGSKGGAISVWGATASTIHRESNMYAQRLRKAIAEDGRLRVGDALLDASRFHAQSNTEFGRETLHSYTILGDPATVLQIAHPNPDVASPEGQGINVSKELSPTLSTYEVSTSDVTPEDIDADGCSVSAVSDKSGLWLLLGFLGLVLACRRRR